MVSAVKMCTCQHANKLRRFQRFVAMTRIVFFLTGIIILAIVSYELEKISDTDDSVLGKWLLTFGKTHADDFKMLYFFSFNAYVIVYVVFFFAVEMDRNLRINLFAGLSIAAALMMSLIVITYQFKIDYNDVIAMGSGIGCVASVVMIILVLVIQQNVEVGRKAPQSGKVTKKPAIVEKIPA